MTRQLAIRPEPRGSVPTTAMVMAAGLGKRMRPLTATRPKPLVEIAGKPLIDHVFDRLIAAGIERVVVNVHYLADTMEAHLAGRYPDIDIAISDERRELLETGGGLVRARGLFGDDPILVVNSDNLWIDGPVDALKLLASRWEDATMDALLLVVPLARAHNHGGLGDFSLDADGRIVARRKPGRVAPFVYTGIQILHPRVIVDAPARGRFRPTCSGAARSRRGAPMRRCIRDYGSTSARPARSRNPRRSSPMAERGAGQPGPGVFTIPAHRAFADTLVAGLMRQTGGDMMALARGLILLPNNRAVRAMTDAFVRASGGGLLLPRLVPLGSPDLGEAIGAALDPVDADDPPPPAIAPMQRRMILARLVAEERMSAGAPVDAAEAVRLSGELCRTLDQLLVEEVPPQRLRDLDLAPELTEHWQRALSTFGVVLDRWPQELARLGRIDAATRRIMVIDRLVARWRAAPPTGFVCAAGITDSAPAVARLLRCVATLPTGTTVFAGLDLALPQAEWDALGPHDPDPATGYRKRSIETHPQFHLKLLLDRMSVARGEVRLWRGGAGPDAGAARGRAIANALAPAAFTGKWTALKAEDRRLAGVLAAEFANPAEEAQGIALALRQAIETEGRTAALVTPDRGLARRVAAHCGRWGIAIDDSAGRPLAILPPGTLLLALAEAATQRFAPLALLALLKHPLVKSGEERLAWLDRVRQLDRALRGPRPAPGLAGVTGHLSGDIATWWSDVRALLAPIEAMFEPAEQPVAAIVAMLRDTAATLCGDALWAGPRRPRRRRFSVRSGSGGGAWSAADRGQGRRAAAANIVIGNRGTAAAGRTSPARHLRPDRGTAAKRGHDDPGRTQRGGLAR